LATLSSAIKLRDSQQEVKKLKEQMKVLNEQRENMPLMIGKSPVMLEVFNSIQKIADADANILILGENGTGKDLVARVIRYYS
jgi:DNA-binding NtrC family response regulator